MRLNIRSGSKPRAWNSYSCSRFVRFVAWILIMSTMGLGYGQDISVESKRASKVKQEVGRLIPGVQIKVVRIQGRDQYGQFISGDNTGFIIFDVDLNQNVTLRFEEVRKIKKIDGSRNSSQRPRRGHKGAIIATCATLGVIGGLLAAVATAKN